MMFVDTHLHLFKSYYPDIDKVMKKAKFNLVKYYINNGCDAISNKEVMDLVSRYPQMYGALGIHPESVSDYKQDDLEFIKKNSSNNHVVAIGEIGLDYHYTKDNKDEQLELFISQLQIAEEYRMPVIVHSREATLDTINALKKYNVKGVIHSFSGSIETAREYVKMGFLLGVNGVITFKNSKLKEVIKKIGLDNIVLETDSPYLTPEPYRGKQNKPEYILDIAKFVADLFGVSLEEVSSITNNNIKRIYKKIKLGD